MGVWFRVAQNAFIGKNKILAATTRRSCNCRSGQPDLLTYLLLSCSAHLSGLLSASSPSFHRFVLNLVYLYLCPCLYVSPLDLPVCGPLTFMLYFILLYFALCDFCLWLYIHLLPLPFLLDLYLCCDFRLYPFLTSCFPYLLSAPLLFLLLLHLLDAIWLDPPILHSASRPLPCFYTYFPVLSFTSLRFAPLHIIQFTVICGQY